MPRYALVVDVSRCDGCGSCFLACKDEHVGNDHLPISVAQPARGRQWLRLDEFEQGEGTKVKLDYRPTMCQHCQKPPCAAGAPEGAVYIRDDGIVILDPEKSKGRSDIAEKCPYGAVSWNEETGLSQKCNMCAHMLDSGEKTTRCAESCPTKALYFGDLDDPESEIAKYVAMRGDFTRLMPELGSEPAVLYRELPAPFITGEVLLADKPDECCPGAVVRCAAKDGTIQETVTDFLGDFQFKGLKKGGEYIVTAAFPGYKTHEQKLTVDKASDLRIVLEK